jgi:hypothetical protein
MNSESESFLTPLGLRWMRDSHDPFGKTEWGLLLVGSVICVLVCRGVAGLLGVPHEPGFNGSLLGGYAPVMSVIAVALAIAVCVIPAVLLGILLGVEGALFCLGVGICGLAARCGGVRSVLQYSLDNRPLIVMAVEAVLFVVIVHFAWVAVAWGSLMVRKMAGVTPTPPTNPPESNAQPTAIPWSALITQVVVTAVGAVVLIQTDQPAQAIGGLSVAVIIGVLAAYLSSDVTDGKWYWFTPAAVGVIGYLFAAFGGYRNPAGDLHGFLAPLARATPLMYAGVGLAAGVFGRWVARRWGQEDEPVGETPAETKASSPGILTKPMAVTPPPPSTL